MLALRANFRRFRSYGTFVRSLQQIDVPREHWVVDRNHTIERGEPDVRTLGRRLWRSVCVQSSRCWQCPEGAGGGFFCGECGSIQPLDKSTNHFETLGMEAIFDIDVRSLEAAFKKIQLRLHPDRFATKGHIEKEYSAQQSSRVNVAYRMLKAPLSRAKYLLELNGVKEEEGTISDPELLMEVMEAQEKVAETSDKDELLAIQKENLQQQELIHRKLAEAFRSKKIDTASKIVKELTYLVRLNEQIVEKL
ncbi:hypothetical protein BSKO_09014 [Bryopsis sp. KO-2023]|nr:hypothetical protein BSKO_09014 [Bryopsis sp. KO-2023]